jgi:hypothetical protein
MEGVYITERAWNTRTRGFDAKNQWESCTQTLLER